MRSLCSLLLFALTLHASDAWLPLEEGTTRTFRITEDGETREVALALAAPSPETLATVVPEAEPSMSWNEETRPSKGMLALREGEEILVVMASTPNGVRLSWNYYGQILPLCEVPLDLTAGVDVEIRTAQPCCGIGIFPGRLRTTSETVSLPAGAFEAIRIDLVDSREPVSVESLWLVRGIGIVKWVKDGRTIELASTQAE